MMELNISATNKTLFFLDTNAFYDFCYLLGFNDFGFNCGINQRVNYDKFKAFVLAHLQNRTLFIPSTTLFEFVCRFRNNEDILKKLIIFLKIISHKYGYNLFHYHNKGIVFTLDEYDTIFWDSLNADYSEIVKWKDTIMQAKIGSEASILTIFSKLISHLYIVDLYKNDSSHKQDISFFNIQLGFSYFTDVDFFVCRKIIAHELYEHYKIGKEFEIKKDIVEIAIDYCSISMTVFIKDFNSSDEDKKNKIFDNSDSVQRKIFRWYNMEKDLKFLQSYFPKFRELLDNSGFNDCQICYIKMAILNLFTQGKKREKNDAEDFWNLCFVNGDSENLISFELELLEAIKQTNKNNYQVITDFYNVEKC